MSMPIRTKTQEARILVVTAEPQIQKLLKSIFMANGYRAFFGVEAAAAIRAHTARRPELVVLDLDLSDLSGHDPIAEIRHSTDVPMIVLSNQHKEADLVAALDRGADDYIEKPFRAAELLARIRSVLRRSVKAHGEEAVYRFGDLIVDILDHRVMRGGESVRLTPTEFDILSLLVRNGGRVVSYQKFVDSLSDAKHCKSRQALRASIWSLRQKVEGDPNSPRILLTEERIGYRLAKDPPRSPS
jgi:two-component system, OmpR family, KDP operon response regulator KdpE